MSVKPIFVGVLLPVFLVLIFWQHWPVISSPEQVPSRPCPAATIAYSDPPYPKGYLASYALTDHCPEIEPGGYFILPEGVVDQGFVMDLGVARTIASVKMKNCHNHFHDRGTENFTVSVSPDMSTWTTIVAGQLQKVWNLPCPIPLETFPVSELVPDTRYIKWTAISYYGHGAGLQYITCETTVD